MVFPTAVSRGGPPKKAITLGGEVRSQLPPPALPCRDVEVPIVRFWTSSPFGRAPPFLLLSLPCGFFVERSLNV